MSSVLVLNGGCLETMLPPSTRLHLQQDLFQTEPRFHNSNAAAAFHQLLPSNKGVGHRHGDSEEGEGRLTTGWGSGISTSLEFH